MSEMKLIAEKKFVLRGDGFDKHGVVPDSVRLYAEGVPYGYVLCRCVDTEGNNLPLDERMRPILLFYKGGMATMLVGQPFQNGEAVFRDAANPGVLIKDHWDDPVPEGCYRFIMATAHTVRELCDAVQKVNRLLKTERDTIDHIETRPLSLFSATALELCQACTTLAEPVVDEPIVKETENGSK
jgi:hypothetical protein